MPTYTVVWRISLDADTAEEAAERAQEWMDDAETKWDFEVVETGSDLDLALDKLMVGAEAYGGEDRGY